MAELAGEGEWAELSALAWACREYGFVCGRCCRELEGEAFEHLVVPAEPARGAYPVCAGCS